MKKIIIILICYWTLSILFTTMIIAEDFTWPSSGYLGWRWQEDTNGQEGKHNGVDIWSNKDGGWNGGIYGNSNPVYSTYPGQIIYTEDVNWHGFIIKHNNNLYTRMWHVRNWQVSLGQNVDQNTVLGNQDYANAVHVHVSISNTSGNSNNIFYDPSSYFGIQLNVNQPNVSLKGTYVTHGNNCGGTNVIINRDVLGVNECSASNSITIHPETHLKGDQRYYIH